MVLRNLGDEIIDVALEQVEAFSKGLDTSMATLKEVHLYMAGEYND